MNRSIFRDSEYRPQPASEKSAKARRKKIVLLPMVTLFPIIFQNHKKEFIRHRQ
jgi:hypothetical protein